MRKLVKILVCIIVLTALGLMGMRIYYYREDANARSAHIAELTALAKEYETELSALKREQEVQELHIYTPDGPGAAVIAFRIADAETIETALGYGERYGFQPAILLNVDDEDAEETLDLLTDSGLELIFSCAAFDCETGARLFSLIAKAKELGCRNSKSFLLRARDDSEENRQTLSKAGMTTLFLFGDSLSSSVTEEFTELNFSYVNRSEYSPANRLLDLNRSEQGLLFAVDMKDTKVTEHQMGEIIDLICREAENGHIRICSVSETVQTVQNRIGRENARLEEYYTAQEKRAARIEELEGIIREIYSHWDD